VTFLELSSHGREDPHDSRAGGIAHPDADRSRDGHRRPPTCAAASVAEPLESRERDRPPIAAGSVSASAAAVDDDEIGEDSGGEPGREEDEPEFAMAVPAHAVPDLTDHVQDGASGDGVEDEL
jgi:hypothetical protein